MHLGFVLEKERDESTDKTAQVFASFAASPLPQNWLDTSEVLPGHPIMQTINFKVQPVQHILHSLILPVSSLWIVARTVFSHIKGGKRADQNVVLLKEG